MKMTLWLALLSTSVSAAAQQVADAGAADIPSSSVQDARIKELERRVEILSQAVESDRTGGSVLAPIPAAGDFGMSPAASKVYEVKDGLSVGGYGETILSLYSQQLQNGNRAPQDSVTDTLRAVLYVGYKLSDWLVFDSEYEFEHGGFSDLHAQGEAIVEFAFLDFLLAKGLNVRAGQILLPLGFINELHEPPIFLGALRPQLEQETSIIPTTWHENGVGVHGELPGNLSYKLYLVNGLNAANFNSGGDTSGSIGGGRQDGHQAIANKPAVTGRLDWHAMPGLVGGISLYAGDSAQRSSSPIWTTLIEGHLEYRAHGFQARAIYARLNNSADGLRDLGASSPGFTEGTLQSGGYLEAGYDVFTFFSGSKQSLIPFVRYEHMNTQQAVVFGATPDGANNHSVLTLGANYKPLPQVAAKVDYQINSNAAATGRNQFNVALGYLF